MARCILLPMVLVIAVVGLLLGGQQDMVQLFGMILAALVLDGTLAFVAFGAPRSKRCRVRVDDGSRHRCASFFPAPSGNSPFLHRRYTGE
ncbi:hypothetical protein J2S64_000863 [Paeniglutamicibacter sulfureus]|uniref:Uncharacterized protein n=1 Tax=Paeniglutamicibacter sulfureus TaxID=43666 RepID=A0ABU2BEV8_9MICC|nr:hypothetical protein [Paeniglutamicibacter sulfureus]